jgi:hypothetical protein
MTRKGSLGAALAFTAFLAGGPGAFSALHDAAGDRAAFAARYENDGASFSVAGLSNRTLVVEMTPPGTAQCTLALDTVAADRKFMADVGARGFDSLECIAYDEEMHISSFEKRKIEQPAPASKPFKRSTKDWSDVLA